MPSIFTRIIEREIPAHILREDDNFLAFLDVRPIRQGHTLVIPRTRSRTCSTFPSRCWAACCRSQGRSRRRSSR
jgi:diadenosine tetraphosphate (Ap4A) HIT family hydrolase